MGLLGTLEICHVHASAPKHMIFVSLGLDCCLTAQLPDRQHSSNPHIFNSFPYIATIKLSLFTIQSSSPLLIEIIKIDC